MLRLRRPRGRAASPRDPSSRKPRRACLLAVAFRGARLSPPRPRGAGVPGHRRVYPRESRRARGRARGRSSLPRDRGVRASPGRHRVRRLDRSHALAVPEAGRGHRPPLSPAALDPDLRTRTGLPEKHGPPRVESWVYTSPFARRVRFTYVDEGAEKQIFNAVVYPAPGPRARPRRSWCATPHWRRSSNVFAVIDGPGHAGEGPTILPGITRSPCPGSRARPRAVRTPR